MNEDESAPTEAAIAKTQSFQERMAALVAKSNGVTSSSPPVAPSMMVQAKENSGAVSLQVAVSKQETGYCRIFPPTFNSVNDLSKQWVEENWSGPSPWCKVEGQPEHPEFEANLAALERALS